MAALFAASAAAPIRALAAGASLAAGRPESADVIVIGSGTAGLCAAVAAREAGAARVTILEKLPMTGGHGILSSGSVAVARRRPTQADPNADVRAMTEEMLSVGGPGVDPVLAHKLASESESAVLWLEDMGVVWRRQPYRAVGSLSARNISTGSPQAGYDYVCALLERALALGVTIRHRHRALSLLTRTNRRTGEETVEGVRVATPAGEIRMECRAVVLATGGFGANAAMRARWAPHLDGSFRTTADPRGFGRDGAEGDGILMAERIGAALTGMEHIQVIPYSGGRLLDFVGGEIWVDDEGRRFVSEGVPFSRLAEVVRVTASDGFWAISDATTQKGASAGVKLAEGIVREAASIEELADGMGVPLVNLRRTIDQWNEDVRRRWDSTFGRPLTGLPIREPPFFYGREYWSVHFTCGGIVIDPYARVLRRTGRPIPGLFAAGETTGGIHGRDRLGGNSMTDTFVFGRTAGRSAAAFAAKEGD